MVDLKRFSSHNSNISYWFLNHVKDDCFDCYYPILAVEPVESVRLVALLGDFSPNLVLDMTQTGFRSGLCAGQSIALIPKVVLYHSSGVESSIVVQILQKLFCSNIFHVTLTIKPNLNVRATLVIPPDTIEPPFNLSPSEMLHCGYLSPHHARARSIRRTETRQRTALYDKSSPGGFVRNASDLADEILILYRLTTIFFIHDKKTWDLFGFSLSCFSVYTVCSFVSLIN